MDNSKLFFAIVIFSVAGFLVVGMRGIFTPNTITGNGISEKVPSAVQDELNSGSQISDSLNGVYVGCVQKCSFSDSSCGQCYCLNFERGCPPLSSDQKLSSYLGKEVSIKGEEGIFGKEQCSSFLKADKIEVLGDC